MYLSERCRLKTDEGKPKDLPGFSDTHKYYYSEESWIYFLNKNLPKGRKTDGWKFCLNIDISALDDAWHLIEPIILSPTSGALGCKVIDIVNFNHERWSFPSGRQIVIYTFNDKDGAPLQTAEAQFSLIIKIENKLRQHHIEPAQTSQGSLKITGSRYVSLRNDIDPEAQAYISREEAIQKNAMCAHNPYAQYNPYHYFTMQSTTNKFFNRLSYSLSSRKSFRQYSEDELIPIPQASHNFSTQA